MIQITFDSNSSYLVSFTEQIEIVSTPIAD